MSLSLQKSQRMPKLKKGIVAYTFLRPNVCEKIHQFLPGTKKMHTKEKWFFFLLRGVEMEKKEIYTDRYRLVYFLSFPSTRETRWMEQWLLITERRCVE